MWWDIPVRLVPLAAVPFLFAWVMRQPLSALGLTLSHPVRDLLIAVPLCLAGFAIAGGFGEYLSRRFGRWFIPDWADLLLQATYYVVLNSPIEELFFRGFLQGQLVRRWDSGLAGLLAASALFGAYHFLGRWDWRAVAGATVAGLGLGVIYLWQPNPPSLLLPTLVHGAITCGFLAVGPALLFAVTRRRIRLQTQGRTPDPVS